MSCQYFFSDISNVRAKFNCCLLVLLFACGVSNVLRDPTHFLRAAAYLGQWVRNCSRQQIALLSRWLPTDKHMQFAMTGKLGSVNRRDLLETSNGINWCLVPRRSAKRRNLDGDSANGWRIVTTIC